MRESIELGACYFCERGANLSVLFIREWLYIAVKIGGFHWGIQDRTLMIFFSRVSSYLANVIRLSINVKSIHSVVYKLELQIKKANQYYTFSAIFFLRF